MPLATRPARRTTRKVRTITTGVLVSVLATVGATLSMASPARADNVVTPGSFTGYGFDQCSAPTQHSMNAWLYGSRYWAAGIYISGRLPRLRPPAEPLAAVGPRPAEERLAAAADHPRAAGVVHHA